MNEDLGPHVEPIRPTSVQKWSRCPMLWYLEDVEGWRSPQARFSPEQLMGTSIHAGMAEFWGGEPQKSTQRALETLSGGWPISGEYSIDGMAELLGKIMLKLGLWCIAGDMANCDILAVETPLQEDGHATPDLVTREDGQLVVTDWKYHHNVKPDYRYYRLQNLDQNHQFQDYSWRVGKKYGEPVRKFRKVGIFGLPSIAILEGTFEPTSEGTNEWLRSARVKWATMHKMRAMGDQHGGIVYRREEGCKPYGEQYPCNMWAACWTCHGDRTMMKQFYVQEPKNA